jgi:RNA polymerase subunit RPABC4/transcription elongation factor Spt4
MMKGLGKVQFLLTGAVLRIIGTLREQKMLTCSVHNGVSTPVEWTELSAVIDPSGSAVDSSLRSNVCAKTANP